MVLYGLQVGQTCTGLGNGSCHHRICHSRCHSTWGHADEADTVSLRVGAFTWGEVFLLGKSLQSWGAGRSWCCQWGKGWSSASILLCKLLRSLSCSKLETLSTLSPLRAGVWSGDMVAALLVMKSLKTCLRCTCLPECDHVGVLHLCLCVCVCTNSMHVEVTGQPQVWCLKHLLIFLEGLSQANSYTA